MKAVFLDIETTGLDSEIHVAIEIGMAIVDFDADAIDVAYSDDVENYIDKMIPTFTSCITCTASDWEGADLEALQINGFNSECIWTDRLPWTVGEEIQAFLIKNEIQQGKAVFICQNPAFDKAFFNQLIPQDLMKVLNLPYHWLDLASMYWAMTYSEHMGTKDYISLSKDSIARDLGLEPEDKPHRAMQGVKHLVKCYLYLMSNEPFFKGIK